jgi:hypothetical protein
MVGAAAVVDVGLFGYSGMMVRAEHPVCVSASERRPARRRRSNEVVSGLTALNVLLAATLGCGDLLDEPYEPQQTFPRPPQGSPPDRGVGLFRYECVGRGDPVCDGPQSQYEYFPEFSTYYPLPRAVAVGSRFDVSYVLGIIEAPSHAASAALLSSEGGVFQARQAGLVGLMGISIEDTVLGWVHLQINEPAGIRVSGLDGAPLVVGRDYRVSAYLVDSSGAPLGGAVDFYWNPANVRLIDVAAREGYGPGWSLDDQVVLRPRAIGVTQLRVRALDVQVELDIEVVASEDVPDAGVAP